MSAPKVRRAEQRKARWYKRRARKRNPLGKMLRGLYEGFREQAKLFSVPSPFLESLKRTNEGSRTTWGGSGTYFDVAPTGPVTTRDTSQEEVPVELHRSGEGPF